MIDNAELMWDTWNNYVEEAKKHLKSDCPLLEDEMIVFMDNQLSALSEKNVV